MLVVLTGEIQTGKTRFLQGLVSQLEKGRVPCYGVLAPGIWREIPSGQGGGFEKLGINNELLPSHELVHFACRATFDGSQEGQCSQSHKAQLGWAIDDSAIDRVNEHFAALGKMPATSCPTGGVLIVDELGRLELMCGAGLTEAVRLLEKGPTESFQHALIVVREALLPCLEGRFQAWGEKEYVTAEDNRLASLLLGEEAADENIIP